MEIKITASAKIGRKLQIFECHLYEDGKPISYKYINVMELKKIGVIKRSSDFKKASAFLNTKEGLKFYDEVTHTNIV